VILRNVVSKLTQRYIVLNLRASTARLPKFADYAPVSENSTLKIKAVCYSETSPLS
jgi:hypothetical protein